MVELLGRRAEAESWTLSLEAETGDPPATMQMETGRPTVSRPHSWWSEGEQMGCQTTAEEAGVGGRTVICEPPGSRVALGNRNPLLTGLRNRVSLWAGLENRSPLRAKLSNSNPLR